MTHILCPPHLSLSHLPAHFLRISFSQVLSCLLLVIPPGRALAPSPKPFVSGFPLLAPLPSGAPFIALEPEPRDCKKGRGPKATSARLPQGPRGNTTVPSPYQPTPRGGLPAAPAAGAAARPRPALMRSGETRAGGGQSGPRVRGGADGWSPDSNRRMRTRWRRSRLRPRCLASPESLPPPAPASQGLSPTHGAFGRPEA